MTDESAGTTTEFASSPTDDASAHDDAEKSTKIRPNPWRDGHPAIQAMAARTLADIESRPELPAAVRAANARILSEYTDAAEDAGISHDVRPSADDDAEKSVAPTKPWWQDHPDIKAMVERSNAEIYGRPDRPPIDYPDPMLEDAWSGRSIRELRDARDDLARAKARYDSAIREGRALGLSWGEIGGIIGVSRQQLHRRYRDTSD